ncbi:hypothetical protein, partial [Streptomyces sp. WAC05374]|uniref:hypothetical protein n=1 Tax=Streptomyces sp. WAC05374 TaxID=2487420 RepID=UPI001C8E4B7D
MPDRPGRRDSGAPHPQRRCRPAAPERTRHDREDDSVVQQPQQHHSTASHAPTTRTTSAPTA